MYNSRLVFLACFVFLSSIMYSVGLFSQNWVVRTRYIYLDQNRNMFTSYVDYIGIFPLKEDKVSEMLFLHFSFQYFSFRDMDFLWLKLLLAFLLSFILFVLSFLFPHSKLLYIIKRVNKFQCFLKLWIFYLFIYLLSFEIN